MSKEYINRENEELENTNDAKKLNTIGWKYLDKKEYNFAIKFFDKAITIEPEEASYYNNRAFAYNKLGQYESALNDYKNAIKYNPEAYWLLYYQRASIYNKLNNFECAINDYYLTLICMEDDISQEMLTDTFFCLATCHYMLQDSLWKRELSIAMLLNHEALICFLFKFSIGVDNEKEVMSLCKETEDLMTIDNLTIYDVVNFYVNDYAFSGILTIYDKDNEGEALKLLPMINKVIKRTKDDYQLIKCLEIQGIMYMSLNKLQDALVSFTKAIELVLNLQEYNLASFLFCTRGICYLKLEDREHALVDFLAGAHSAKNDNDEKRCIEQIESLCGERLVHILKKDLSIWKNQPLETFIQNCLSLLDVFDSLEEPQNNVRKIDI